MAVRRLVHSLGFRYRLNVRALPGSPDLVFPSRRKVVFVHGCFWHRHRCRYGRPQPKTRAAFWRKKLLQNVERDRIARKGLKDAGWQTLVVWQCQTRLSEQLSAKLIDFLSS
jgi:DNA mismatch endonuclease (patch repair protein)